ncbi:hypothetical protein [Streptomyces sp. FXJ1.172]|uniref:hypothetical protein n=1 Tax=Streptomyces sp. FXJ1.172 TaxID=710705 RepID=UPI0007CF77B5
MLHEEIRRGRCRWTKPDPLQAELVEYLHTAAEEVDYDLVLSTATRRRDERTAVETLPAFRSEDDADASADRTHGWVAGRVLPWASGTVEY